MAEEEQPPDWVIAFGGEPAPPPALAAEDEEALARLREIGRTSSGGVIPREHRAEFVALVRALDDRGVLGDVIAERASLTLSGVRRIARF